MENRGEQSFESQDTQDLFLCIPGGLPRFCAAGNLSERYRQSHQYQRTWGAYIINKDSDTVADNMIGDAAFS